MLTTPRKRNRSTYELDLEEPEKNFRTRDYRSASQRLSVLDNIPDTSARLNASNQETPQRLAVRVEIPTRSQSGSTKPTVATQSDRIPAWKKLGLKLGQWDARNPFSGWNNTLSMQTTLVLPDVCGTSRSPTNCSATSDIEWNRTLVLPSVDNTRPQAVTALTSFTSPDEMASSTSRVRRSSQRVSYVEPNPIELSDEDKDEKSSVTTVSDFEASTASESDEVDDLAFSDEDTVEIEVFEDEGTDEEMEEPPARPQPPTRSKPRASTTRAAKPTKSAKTEEENEVGVNLNLGLPPISNVEDSFLDMTKIALGLGLGGAVTRLKRPLTVATMCSGTDAPLIALDLISRSLESLKGPPLSVIHRFSAEIEVVKQGFIERNFQPELLFRDVREFIPDEAETAITAFGASRRIPRDLDILIAGFVCKDLSRLNSNPKTLEDQGESGDTWLAVYSYVKKFHPSVVLVENVQSTPKNWNDVKSAWAGIGYEAEWGYFDTKNYYLPQTRNRMYMIAINAKLFGDGADEAAHLWKETMLKLQRRCSSPFEAFLTEHVPDQPVYQSRVSEVSWDLCKLSYAETRSAEGLGLKRPISQWSETGIVRPPDFANRKWYLSQSSRVWDAIDVASLLAAKDGYDALFKMAVWDVSQNVERFRRPGRTKKNFTFGVLPCITPSGCDFVSDRQTALSGSQLLLLQGMPYSKMLFGNETQKEQQDLAGNAMSSTVIGAALIAALISSRSAFRTDKGNDDHELIAQRFERRQNDFLPVGSMNTETLITPTGTDLDLSKLLSDVRESSRLCNCEGSKHVSRSLINTCKECGHTSCADCSGNPTHAYLNNPLPYARLRPIIFETRWRSSLPPRLQFSTFPDLATEVAWQPFSQYLDGVDIRAVYFSIDKFERLDNSWKICYNSKQANLELFLGSHIQWRLFLKSPDTEPANGSLRQILNQPLARCLVKDNLLDPAWEILTPDSTTLKLTVTGSGVRKQSWRNRLGLVEHRAETVPEHLAIDVHSHTTVAQQICGSYDLLPECGTASSSLYKKVGGTPLFLFLESNPLLSGATDHFVFSYDKKRVGYGRSRDILAHVERQWRPWNQQQNTSNTIEATITEKWTKSKIRLDVSDPGINARCLEAQFTTPHLNDCSRAITILDVETNASCDERASSGYSWVLEHARSLPKLDRWQPWVDQNEGQSCDCAPQFPSMRWAKGKDDVVTAYEDRRAAASFERKIKTRPAIIDIKPASRAGHFRIQIGVNIASLVHRAQGSCSAFGTCRAEWRLVTNHVAQPWDRFPQLFLQKSTNEPYLEKVFPYEDLKDEQRRSLAWMREQEAGIKHTIVEVEEEVHTGLGWRAEAQAARDVQVRGGVLADLPSFGKTVTTIALIQSEFEKMSPVHLLRANIHPLSPPHDLVDIAATLIVCPDTLAAQWKDEFRKFLGSTLSDDEILLIENHDRLLDLTIQDFQQARVVIVSWKVFSDEAYIARLAQFTAMPLPQSTTGRGFAAWLEYSITELPSRLNKLQCSSVKTFLANVDADIEDRLKEEAFHAIAPLTIQHGSAYKSYTEMQAMDRAKSLGKKRKTMSSAISQNESGSNWASCSNPVFQLFRFNRIVIDEYHYLFGDQGTSKIHKEMFTIHAAVKRLSAHKRWLLSGTPPLDGFSDVNRIAGLLGVTLGKNVLDTASEKRTMADRSPVEQFLSRTESFSYDWHKARHERAQDFLDKFVRQNEPVLKDISFVETLNPIEPSIGHRAVYLELSQHLISQRMQIKKLKGSSSDRQSRLNASLDNSATAEDALLKTALFFESKGGPPIDVLVGKRRRQVTETETEISQHLSDAEYNQRRCGGIETRYTTFKRNSTSRSAYGDSDASEKLRALIARAKPINFSLAKGASAEVKLKTVAAKLHSLVEELTHRQRSLRFIESIKQVLGYIHSASRGLMKCSSLRCSGSAARLSELFLISQCGHMACAQCLHDRADPESCVAAGCDIRVSGQDLIASSNLGSGEDENMQSGRSFGKKADAIAGLVKKLPRNDQVLLFVPNEEILHLFKDVLDYHQIDYYAQGSKRSQLAKDIGKFRNGEGKALLLDLQDESASGLNLPNANHVVFISPLLTDSQYQYESIMAQAVARSRRYGQKKRVHIYHFAAIRTMDVDILEHRHQRCEALWDSEDAVQVKESLPKKEKTKFVRNSVGNAALIPLSWLKDSEMRQRFGLDAEVSETFTSLVNFSETFTRDEE
ncbi:hypothetical protein EJ04DRAFT_559764 [Polyplosphaeria fusca]|uniref:Helicase ATP-binding domain-containing protein n=1 Tax=Polyplosphaeria fusca TaxID=682080 RepID=A0A9P4V628_9PLEO|nr:hypothetical protein EJ04DRAFT_559764 [Polyplosphaeria fusca]